MGGGNGKDKLILDLERSRKEEEREAGRGGAGEGFGNSLLPDHRTERESEVLNVSGWSVSLCLSLGS